MRWLVSVSIFLPLLIAICGCGRPHRSEIHYPGLKFISPQATGEYHLLVFDEVRNPSVDKSDANDASPSLHLRLDGKTVLRVRNLTPQTAEQHGIYFPDMAEKGLYPASRTVSVAFREGNRLYVTVGSMNGQQSSAVEIGVQRNGTFYRLPLSRDQIIELFGPPMNEFERDYEYAN